jgi:hypothetical protein
MLSLKTLGGYFDENGWKYMIDEEHHAIRSGFSMKWGDGVYLSVYIIQDTQVVVFIFQNLGKVTKERKADLLPKLMDINYKLDLGKYTCDATDGEVTFEIGVPTNGTFTLAQFMHCMALAIVVMEEVGLIA